MSDFSNVDALRGDCVRFSATPFDFGHGWLETWEYVEASECEECGHISFQTGEDPCPECGDGWLLSEGPMMNYWWPLPDEYFDLQHDTHDMARRLLRVPLCVVVSLDTDATPTEYGLALTGGGMDLSWEIAAAYVRLGFLPPAELSLPKFAGMQETPRRLAIVNALERANSILVDQYGARKRSMEDMRNWLQDQ